MKNSMKLLMAASAAVFMTACEHTASSDTEVATEEAVKPMVEAETSCGPRQARAAITLNENNAPAFGASSGGGSTPNGGCVSFINLAAEGNIDLTGFGRGNVALSISLDDKIWGAGYRFPADPFQAIGIAIVPPGSPTSPVPQFGKQYWPNQEFGWPSIANGGRTVNFVDVDDNDDVYEYGINLVAPNNEIILMDPRVENSGGTGNK